MVTNGTSLRAEIRARAGGSQPAQVSRSGPFLRGAGFLTHSLHSGKRMRPMHRNALLALAFLNACDRAGPLDPRGGATPFHAEARAVAGSVWSTPVKLGPAINVPLVTDGNAVLSPDGRSLYFDSDRTDLPGAQGARDLWVSRRACTDWQNPDCEWQTPSNLGPSVNTPYVEGLPTISADGHLLFWSSHTTRTGCPAEPDEADPTRPCDTDIYVSWRADIHDDLGWGPAVALPAPVNTGGEDNVSAFVTVGEPGRGNLYVDLPGGTGPFDMYTVPIAVTARAGPGGPAVQVLGPITPLQELNLPTTFDGGVTLRADGRELFFTSNRVGGTGALDIWSSTRRSPHDPWSAPANVAEVNSSRGDLTPRVSRDGEVLLFVSNRDMPNLQCISAGLVASCGWDIYVSVRRRQEQ